jgi:AcrR family transcriptional regulator
VTPTDVRDVRAAHLGALRADARRNRGRVLDAARAAFAERGLEAQMDEIARAAGVGVGTVYRHFETKEALLEAVALEPLGELTERCRAALDEEDAGAALESFMRFAVEKQVHDRCIGESSLGSVASSPALIEARAALGAVAAELLARAQAAGAIRPDLVVDDLPMLVFGIGNAQRLDACVPVTNWRRHLEIVLDGIRAPGTAPLPTP